MKSFEEFGLLPSLQHTLKEKGLSRPTEVQAKAIPILMSSKSVVGISETGSGKTLAYVLPLLHAVKSLELKGDAVAIESTPRAIVMVPTSELGEQISRVFKHLTHDTRVRVRPALGGMTMAQARRNVAGPFEILLATPGRLKQLMEIKAIHLDDVRMLIFDEADQMLDDGFLPYSKLIVRACPEALTLGLFSATVSPKVQELMTELFADAEVIRSQGSGKVVESLITKNLMVEDGKRWPLFEKVLSQKIEGGTIVFTNTREQCDKLAAELMEKGFRCGIYRGEMDKLERRKTLKSFREGQLDLLVSTDLGGRGLDIGIVGRVINYHLPKEMKNYLHRAGRTARAGQPGLVVNLVTERDEPLISRLGGTAPPPRAPQASTSRQSFGKRKPAAPTARYPRRP